MKLTVFQADKGDCLLLTGADETRVLIDGGLAGSYSKHVAARLGEIREAGGHLDVVYVSHIDDDHISGGLQLLEDEVAWRVHESQLRAGNRHQLPGCVHLRDHAGVRFFTCLGASKADGDRARIAPAAHLG